MKKQFQVIVAFFSLLFMVSCSTENPISETTSIPIVTVPQTQAKSYNYLALGDSYTIGQSVCETCRFPAQLSKSLGNLNVSNTYSLKIIAQTGWTTSNLISAVNTQNLTSNYDLVTLLIGVNNQYQNRNFSLYEKEFPELVKKAIALAKGDKTNVILVSIPDYAYTPFGQASGNQTTISTEIDQYNAFAKKYCDDNAIVFINITDITRQGLTNKNLVASDGLHPSELAYSLFVERILPKATTAVNN
ncbi:SGNH/GDSL hydrolase family protein [Flavobacterium yafengii]|jgi:acyl-CoA thioesterase-1|uniref:SGNH/GDSL hydrolase family protein n=1 Tax=Flavobacterium yafengii TaxID=3041253 RepID=UPI0024A9F1BE|nr:SGNH/GDSL hydrolase family protein [Flavobacterium yafengii]MDI5899429.1 SGNH/GDSL hydrolase family protein [Flavobacterium yafengii]MDI6045823.1 SGNH/GDSL hydrolase family protein [Flavobacterium yafengii]